MNSRSDVEAMREAAASACEARAVRSHRARGGMGQIFADTQDDEALACASAIRSLPLPEIAEAAEREWLLSKAREALGEVMGWIHNWDPNFIHDTAWAGAASKARRVIDEIDAATSTQRQREAR
jgi:hypothetical protein